MGDEVKYKITADASGLIAQSAAAADALKGTASAAGAEGQGLEESAKKHTFLSLKKSELKKLTKELAHEFPLAGMAAKAMLNPVVFAFTAAIGIFGAAKTKLEEWNKAMDASAASMATKDFLPGIEAKEASLQDAAVKAAEYSEAIKHAGEGEDTFARMIQAAIDKVHELGNAMAEINNAKEAQEMAQVDMDEKGGKLSEPAAIAKRAGIKEKYRKLSEVNATRQEDDEIALKQSEFERDQKQAPDLSKQTEAARSARDATAARIARDKADLDEGKRKEVEFSAAAAEAQQKKEEAENLIRKGARRTAIDDAQLLLMDVGQRRADAEHWEGLANTRKSMNEKTKKAIEHAETKVLPGQEQALKDAASRETKNTDRVGALKTELPGAYERAGIRQAARERAGGMQDAATQMGAVADLKGREKNETQEAKKLEQEMAQAAAEGKMVSAATIQHAQAIKQELAATRKALEQALKSLSDLQKAQKASPVASM